MEFAEVYRRHLARYPLLQPVDAIKLAYQSELGPAHLAPQPREALRRLQEERAAARPASVPLLEDIGGAVRLHLNAAQFGAEREKIAAWMFCRTAQQRRGNAAGYAQKLELLLEREDAFAPGALREAIAAHRRAGCPMVSHSETYRRAYAPCYRVVDSRLAGWFAAFCAVEDCQKRGGGIVAIDGRCGSGKTALAAALAEYFGCPVVHMDDFFLPPALRTPQRLATPGENVHHERVQSEVLQPLLQGRDARYRRFDCAKGAPGDTVEIPAGPLVIVEGSYALHRSLAPYYACKLFLEVSPPQQRRRLARREGENLPAFLERWIPLEEAYISAYGLPGQGVTVIPEALF